MECRCGRDEVELDGDVVHLCHYNGYTCENPGTEKFVPNPYASISGSQPKLTGYFTFACDEHWELFMSRHKKQFDDARKLIEGSNE